MFVNYHINNGVNEGRTNNSEVLFQHVSNMGPVVIKILHEKSSLRKKAKKPSLLLERKEGRSRIP